MFHQRFAGGNFPVHDNGNARSKMTIRAMARRDSLLAVIIVATLLSRRWLVRSLLPAVKREQRTITKQASYEQSWTPLPWINASINSHRHLFNRRVPLHTCPPLPLHPSRGTRSRRATLYMRVQGTMKTLLTIRLMHDTVTDTVICS